MIYEHKIKINNLISKVKDKNMLKKIFLLVHAELSDTDTGECKYTHNNNGIFFDLNLLSDKTLLDIEATIQSINTSNNNSDSESLKYTLYSNDDNVDYLKISNGSKLSNKEKNLINNFQKDKV